MQEDQQPGWVFKPADQSDEPPAAPQQEQAPAPPVIPEAAPVEEAPPAPALEPEPWAAASENQGQPLSPDVFSQAPPHIEWTASEYIANPKSKGWFSLLALGSIVLAVAVYFITDDIVSAAVVALAGVILGVFAARSPRVLNYALDNRGLHIGEKLYAYETFKSFSVGDDHAMSYIQLMPLRRFMPPITLHYDPADEERIADTLAAYLPVEEHKHDMVENLSRRLRL